MSKLRISQAIIVEGRDDVRAVKEACDALIIPTHGFGIGRETWDLIEKAYNEKGIIILSDPDHAGSEIRRRLSDRFPEAIQAYIAREDATEGSDIGVENARADAISEAISKALKLAGKKEQSCDADKVYADASDMAELGLSGGRGSSELRALVCRDLGIGYANASAMIKKLKGFGIDIDELNKAVEKFK